MFQSAFKSFLGRKVRPTAVKSRPSVRPQLEKLECRLVPALASSTTNAVVQINPSFATGTVTETVTATVQNFPTYDPTTGVTTPIPPGTPTPSGTVFFNLNNQQQTATLNSNGQATVTFTMPFFTLLTSQELTASFRGDAFHTAGLFNAPLYTNFDNLIFASTLTFGQLTPQQLAPTYTNGTVTAERSFNTAQGETDNIAFVSFLYKDPGTISNVVVFGLTLPGSFAARLNAYGPSFNPANSSSSSSNQ